MTETPTATTPSASSSDAATLARRRVVITGMGLINPIGSTLETFWDALVHGRSGIKPIELFDASRLPTRIAGEVADFNAKQYVDKKERKNLKVMARSIQFAVAAAQLALDDSAIDKTQLDPTRFGVEFGSGLMATDLAELAGAAEVSDNCQPGQVDLIKWGSEGMPQIPPLWMLKYLPNMPACHVSILHNAQGPNNSITESEAAGLLALGEAFRIVQRDGADIFIAGGADSKLNPLSMVRQCLFGHLSQCNDEPERACRPFDKNREGMVIGEGAGVVILEDLSHAQARTARIYAEVVGFGASFDGGVGKSGAGIARAITAALREAGIGIEDIDHISAHGLGTVTMDIWEAKGLHLILPERWESVPVFAAKGYFGNLGAGGGPTELIASLLALQRGTLPATVNLEERDPACSVGVLPQSRPTEKPFVLKISFTDMGQCAALVCRIWD